MVSLSPQVPVAFFIFNRPDTTAQVFEAIRQVQPQQLFVIADGPRSDRNTDSERCGAARAIIEQIDWDCQVFKNYAETNMGCRQRVASGLTWVFEQVEAAIILEDDCVPDLSFFHFCQELLHRYREDERVMSISGSNIQRGEYGAGDSYYFSRYPYVWGWATWRRAWQHYNVAMPDWTIVKDTNWLQDILHDPQAEKHWSQVFQKTFEGRIDTWDFAFVLSCWLQNGWSIHPSVNLVSNIGFHPEATHTKDDSSPFAAMPTVPMDFPLQHPRFLLRNMAADHLAVKTIFNETLLMQIRAKLRKTVKSISFFRQV
jgi:hypothetical protein